MPKLAKQAQEVLDFWFSPSVQPLWFVKSAEFDAQLSDKFATLLHRASLGELDDWRQHILGRLAEIIVLDQFSRNIYRDTAQAFAQDAMALVLAQTAVALPDYADLNTQQKHFLLMPYMHSESVYVHTQAVRLFSELGEPMALDFELQHKAIIDRFGRYPHRNVILGRVSSAEELAF